LENGILDTIPNAELNGHRTQRLANTTNLRFPGITSEALLLLLDQAGVCASSGSACLADSPDPSHVIRAMKGDVNAAGESIRFSLGTAQSSLEIEAAIAAISQAVGNLHSFAALA
jgi:cysteine desulfurase